MDFRQKNAKRTFNFNCFSHFNGKSVFVAVFLFVFLGLTVTGCTRGHYRARADKEVYSILANGTAHARQPLDYRLEVKPESRMFDPAERAISPPHRLQAENPLWRQTLLTTPKGTVHLNKNEAIRLALLHSPEYQAAFENLYLTAMKVSQERFRFDVQFYGGESLFYSASGQLRGGSSPALDNALDFGFHKRFATGAELLISIANSITWNFSGQDYWSAESLLNISLVQPLLRNAGRKIVLEELTQAERNFLTAIRQVVFFQQGFYAKTVTGNGGQSLPQGGISHQLPNSVGGFYGLLSEQIQIKNQQQNIVSLKENLNLLKEFFEAGQLDDKYQVEQMLQNLLNSESSLLNQMSQRQTNVDTYLRSLGLPPDLSVEINDPLIEKFQLTSPALMTLQEQMSVLLAAVRKKDQPLPMNFVQNLQTIVKKTESEISSLSNDLAVLERAVPKRREGLQTLARQHQEQANGEQLDLTIFSADAFQKRVDELKNREIPKCLRCTQAAMVLTNYILSNTEQELRLTIANNKFPPQIQLAVRTLETERLVNLSPVPTISNPAEPHPAGTSVPQAPNQLTALRESMKTSVGATTEEWKLDLTNRLAPKGAKFAAPNIDYAGTEETEKQKQARETAANLNQKDPYRDWVRNVLAAFQNEILSLTLAQTRVRLDSITLDQTDIQAEEAFKTAAENRLDWMNARMKLEDSYRKISIAANQLQGDMNVKVNGELGTVDKRGVRFDQDNSKLTVGLEWDSPLTRHNEMMTYRQRQIEYQAARRDYYLYVDSVQAEIRRILRTLKNNQIDFEIKRNAILSAAMQVDLMQLKLSRPPSRGSKLDTNTSRDLIDGLNNLTNRQNEFLTTWIACQTQRMLLDLNRGTMQLDENSRWIDEDESVEKTSVSPLPLAPIPMPIPRLAPRQ